MATYSSTSPWYNTALSQDNYLNIMAKRSIPSDPDDLIFEISPQYTFRPDLLSFDLYGSPKLWWVFAMRNMDVIKDPVFDFTAGTKIYVPKKSVLTSIIGL